MNPAAFAIKKPVITIVLSLITMVAGVAAYFRLGRLENPDFVIKTAVVMTQYPGATPEEVEKEVTDRIEEAIQKMDELKEIWSTSQEGLSVVYAEMKDKYQAKELPQVWDKLRRKVGDMQGTLPPGAGPSIVNDDFGDVYGLFYAITGDAYSYEELREYARDLTKELLLCQDVAKVATWGTQTEVIHIEIRHARLAELGLSAAQVIGVLTSQNVVQGSGKVDVGDSYVRITPTGEFMSEQQIGDLLITDPASGASFRLRDIAEIRRDYYDPPMSIMRYNGKPAIGLGISTVIGGNAVNMAEAVQKRLEELKPLRPEGIEMEAIYNQGEICNEAVNGFVLNLVESVIIVIVLLVLFMGWRSGLLIGAVLILTILATFCYMLVDGIALQKISLGALILALGMLVDNAIVVVEGVLINTQKGMSKEEAAIKVVGQTQWPLFGATVIAMLAFAAIGFAPGNVGEFCQTLFWVLGASLLFSWIFAITVTPLLCVWCLPVPKTATDDPYAGWFYRFFRHFVHRLLALWPLSLVAVALAVAAGMVAFSFVPSFFFAGSTQPYCYVDFYRPQGVKITNTSEDLANIEQFVLKQDHVAAVSTYVGQTSLRYMLPIDVKDPNSAYGQILIKMDNYQYLDELMEKLGRYIRENYPDSESNIMKFQNGPPLAYRIELQFRGPDKEVLRELADKAKTIMRRFPTKDVRDDWRNRVPVLRPEISETAARKAGITRDYVAKTLQMNFGGMPVGYYREEEDLIPMIVRAPKSLHDNYADARKIQVWSPVAGRSIPLEQVITNWDRTEWEDSLIKRRYRMREIEAQCNPKTGLASTLLNQMMPVMEEELLG